MMLQPPRKLVVRWCKINLRMTKKDCRVNHKEYSVSCLGEIVKGSVQASARY